MLVFVVPIKSKQVSTNWEVFSLLVERSVRSLCQQTSQNFKVVAVCHEIPEIGFEHPNLEFIQVTFDPPTNENITKNWGENKVFRNAAKEADKAKKLLEGIKYAKDTYNPSHFMVSDADDCVSNKLVSFVEKDNDQTVGWYFKKGFIYNEGSNLTFLNKNTFNVLCGTCIIIKATHIEMLFDEKPLPVYSHELTTLSSGEKLTPLPFPGAIYSIGNTENYCSTPEAVKKMNSYNFLSVDFYQNIVRKMTKYRVKWVSDSFRDEFGLTKLDFSSVFSEKV